MATTTERQALDPLDYLALDALLDGEERAIRDTVREFVRARVLPDVGDWFEKGAPSSGSSGYWGCTSRGTGSPVRARSHTG
jgi:hypothetical protein